MVDEKKRVKRGKRRLPYNRRHFIGAANLGDGIVRVRLTIDRKGIEVRQYRSRKRRFFLTINEAIQALGLAAQRAEVAAAFASRGGRDATRDPDPDGGDDSGCLPEAEAEAT